MDANGCVFCRIRTREPEKVFGFNQDAYVIEPDSRKDGYHRLVIPYRHGPSLAVLANAGVWRLVAVVAEKLMRETDCPDVNISVNYGKVAGQQVLDHLHIWVVARRPGQPSSGFGLATLIKKVNGEE